VPAKNFSVAVLERGRPLPPLKLVGAEPVKMTAGGTAHVQFSLNRTAPAEQIHLTLIDPPEGIALEKESREKDGMSLVLHADDGKVKPGQKGNLIVEVFFDRAVNPGNGKPPAAKRRISLGTLPAIHYEIIEEKK
jgi:hypothetical protein